MQLVPDHDPDHDEELAGLRTGFPQFRIWREISCDRTRYVARSLQQGTRPHTIVTADPGELRAALSVGVRQTRAERRRVLDKKMPNIARIGWLVGLDTRDPDHFGVPRDSARPDIGPWDGAPAPSLRETWWPGAASGRPPRRPGTGRRVPARGNQPSLMGRPGLGGEEARPWRESPEDVRCWQEAARLRHEHPGWVVLWLARIRQFRAYRLRARKDTVLTASTPADLAAQITRSEQEMPVRPPRPRRPT